MGEFTQILNSLPVAVSVGISLIAIGLTWFLNYKKVDVEDKSAFNNVQQQQVKSLMDQIELLSRELQLAREQLAGLHNQNIQLMEQLRLSNRRISELESALEKHKTED